MVRVALWTEWTDGGDHGWCTHVSDRLSLPARFPGSRVLDRLSSIAWPFEYDQPLSAMLISLVHDIGYELLQIRTGENGLKKPYRATSEEDHPKGTEDAWRAEMRKVLKLAFSEDGDRKRANMLRLRERIVAGWQEDGETMKELRSFIEYIDKDRE